MGDLFSMKEERRADYMRDSDPSERNDNEKREERKYETETSDKDLKKGRIITEGKEGREGREGKEGKEGKGVRSDMKKMEERRKEERGGGGSEYGYDDKRVDEKEFGYGSLVFRGNSKAAKTLKSACTCPCALACVFVCVLVCMSLAACLRSRTFLK